MSALQNLAIEKKPEDQQQAGPETATGLQATAKQSSSGNISSDSSNPEEAANYDNQPEGRATEALTINPPSKMLSNTPIKCTCSRTVRVLPQTH